MRRWTMYGFVQIRRSFLRVLVVRILAVKVHNVGARLLRLGVEGEGAI